MEYAKFVRKPFVVDAVKITRDNIEELAPLIGTLEYKEDGSGTPYINVNYRLVPGVPRVYLGFYMTKVGNQIRCYSKRAFINQFCEHSPEIEAWVNYINNVPPPAPAQPEEVTASG